MLSSRLPGRFAPELDSDTFFLRVMRRIWRLWDQAAWGRGGSLLTQWIVKYGYVPVVLIGMAGLAHDIGTRESNSGVSIVAKTPVLAEAPVVPGALAERRPPAPETRPEPKPGMQLAALDPHARLLDASD